MTIFDRPRRQLSQPTKKDFSHSLKTLLLICSFIIVVSLWIANDYQQPYMYQTLIPSFDKEQNSKEMKEWRESLKLQCQEILDSETLEREKIQEKETLEIEAMKKFSNRLEESSNNLRGDSSFFHHKKYEYCRNAFIDLGTNIGDSIGYFVDSALDICSPLWSKKYPRTRYNERFPHPHLHVSDLKIYSKGYKANPLLGSMQKYMSLDPPMVPEDTCVYGMEGNPAFTERLQKLENHIMAMRPRPIRHLHIHTESVVTEKDGPTKLYLDKTSVKENFWGSSILSSQQDAVKTAKEMNNGTAIAANVDGIRLSTLVQNTMLPFKPEATESDKRGGTLIVKMDVEGAEYLVIKELAKSNILCDYIKMGNKVVLIVEMHHNSITDPKERLRLHNNFRPAKKQLEDCGVEFGKLHAYWS